MQLHDWHFRGEPYWNAMDKAEVGSLWSGTTNLIWGKYWLWIFFGIISYLPEDILGVVTTAISYAHKLHSLTVQLY